jgi:outer membrane murein-binding lipoprotein Lpp
MKKFLSIAIAACLTLGLLSGCASTAPVDNTATPAPTAGADGEAAVTRDWAAIRDKYDVDAVVMTVNGSEVTWGEFFYWMYSNMASLESYMGSITDFDAVFPYGDGTQTYGEYCLAGARDPAVQYHAIYTSITATGVELSDEDRAAITATEEADALSNCGEGATIDDLHAYLETIYVPVSLYDFTNEVSVLMDAAFAAQYGKDGSSLSDADLAAYIETNGYMTAKHILLGNTDSEGVALTEEQLAEKKAQAQSIVDQLSAEKDQDKRLALFDSLMAEYNEDTGENSYPGGYCFPTGKMDAAFEDACKELGEYEVSGVVEGTYGYHIILRMPTTGDDVVQYYSEEQQYTLRYAAAADVFNTVIDGWINDAEVVWSPEFESFSVSDLMK